MIKFCKYRLVQFCSYSICAVVLMGCDSGERDEGNSAGNDSSFVTLPIRLQNAKLSETGVLEGFLVCNGEEHEMTILNTQAIGTCSVLISDNPHSIRVDYTFTSNLFGGSYMMATAEKADIEVDSDGLLIELMESDFSYDFDDDEDRITNYDEIISDTNPDDAMCVIGHSIIGVCQL